MADRLLEELERFATSLIDAQQTLLDLMKQKRIALASSDIIVLGSLEPAETEAAQKLQSLITWRSKLLDAARRAGREFENLTEFAQSLHAPPGSNVIDLLERAKSLAAELQQESWVHWVITNRCCNFYGEVLELIAHHGKKPPTYQSTDWVQRGGAVLNASA